MNIHGTRAILTGATGGIGRACAIALLEGGAARVGLLARDSGKLDSLVEEMGAKFDRGRVVKLVADVCDADALSRSFNEFSATAGGLDVLINNAGVLMDGVLFSASFRGIRRYPYDSWKKTLDTNLTGMFLCSQLAVELMVTKRCKGVIVNISSVSRLGRAGQAAYSASKGGVASFSLSLAQELAPCGIRCVAIAPGLVDTPMAAQIPEAYRQQMLQNVLAGRMGQPSEIAHGLLFCIENDFFNGRILELDGGVLS